ncbi:hypothetical protein HYT51_00395 [Candidatus Woesearchaeota archaeon]|nr:hypothetical protein [Candidatus Woesearchaeota archaeon]
MKKTQQKKEAQASTEYMVILAVTLILAFIIISVMGGTPEIGIVGRGKALTNYWNSQPVGTDAYAIAKNGKFVFSIKNNLRTNITLQNIGISLPQQIGGTFNGSESLQPGNSILVYNNQNGLLLGTEKCSEGKTYSYKIIITYSDENGNIIRETGNDGSIPLQGICVENIPQEHEGGGGDSDDGKGGKKGGS